MATDFAPEERATGGEIALQTKNLESNQEIKRFLDAVPEPVLILNKERQIVYVNQESLITLGINNLESVQGLRPGESFKCIHAIETSGGCGTTKFCRLCGAVNSILGSQKGQVTTEECRIIRSDTTTAIDLKVKASPYEADGVNYTILAVSDISAEKRKEALESIFFHDIMNTAGGLSGFSELMLDAEPEDTDKFKVIIHSLSGRIVDEIKAQRMLVQAENGQLQPQYVKLNSKVFLQEVVSGYSKHDVAKDKIIEMDSESDSIDFTLDNVLLGRVLGNLLKNALEAINIGDSVKVACYRKKDKVEFLVRNHCVIPTDVQMQIFQRSFSTKGTGRGLGTYSIKLLTEKYLNGRVHFVSNENEGTTFYASYPID